MRGAMVMKGYWDDPDGTAAVVRDGWLHTGDIGRIDDDGYLQITDRKKDIIVISGGDNISPRQGRGRADARARDRPGDGLRRPAPASGGAAGRRGASRQAAIRDDRARRSRRRSSAPTGGCRSSSGCALSRSPASRSRSTTRC